VARTGKNLDPNLAKSSANAFQVRKDRVEVSTSNQAFRSRLFEASAFPLKMEGLAGRRISTKTFATDNYQLNSTGRPSIAILTYKPFEKSFL
jgi:hypothetical protein